MKNETRTNMSFWRIILFDKLVAGVKLIWYIIHRISPDQQLRVTVLTTRNTQRKRHLRSKFLPRIEELMNLWSQEELMLFRVKGRWI